MSNMGEFFEYFSNNSNPGCSLLNGGTCVDCYENYELDENNSCNDLSSVASDVLGATTNLSFSLATKMHARKRNIFFSTLSTTKNKYFYQYYKTFKYGIHFNNKTAETDFYVASLDKAQFNCFSITASFP